jgi:hypothetical protein
VSAPAIAGITPMLRRVLAGRPYRSVSRKQRTMLAIDGVAVLPCRLYNGYALRRSLSSEGRWPVQWLATPEDDKEVSSISRN